MEPVFQPYAERRRGFSDAEVAMILEMEKDMDAIRRMSGDMNDIIAQQGENITMLGDNVESAKVQTEIAEKDLIKASDYQSSWRYTAVITLIAGTTVISVPLGLTLGAKAGLISAGCCVGLGAVKTFVESFKRSKVNDRI